MSSQWNGCATVDWWRVIFTPLAATAIGRSANIRAFAEVEREPQDGVHFCGEHTSIDAQGYLEGAVETGERAANEIISALR
jgi:monoamine oxidase